MKPEALTVKELQALRTIGDHLHFMAAKKPFAADRHYHTCEVVPDEVLTPEHVRSICRQHLAGMTRAVEIEAYVTEEIKIDGERFLDWERRLRA